MAVFDLHDNKVSSAQQLQNSTLTFNIFTGRNVNHCILLTGLGDTDKKNMSRYF